MTVKADVAPGLLVDDKVREIRAWLADAELDPRVVVTFKGEDEEQKEAQAFLDARPSPSPCSSWRSSW